MKLLKTNVVKKKYRVFLEGKITGEQHIVDIEAETPETARVWVEILCKVERIEDEDGRIVWPESRTKNRR